MENPELTFDENDLHAIVESLHDALESRVAVCLTAHDSGHTLRTQFKIDQIQDVLNAMANVYTKSYMTLADLDEVDPEFLEYVRLGPVFWDLFHEIVDAKDFKAVPIHEEHLDECEICEIVY